MSTLREHADANAFAAIMAAKMSETTCPTHGWNQPCYTCVRLARHDNPRRREVWSLGNICHKSSEKTIRIRTPKRRPA